MKKFFALVFSFTLLACGDKARTTPVNTLQNEIFPDFLYSLYPAPGGDAVWAHLKGDLTRVEFDAKGKHLTRHAFPGIDIATPFKLFQPAESAPILINENRGLSWLDMKSKADLLPFCAKFEYSGDRLSGWLFSPNDKAALVTLTHDKSGDPNAMPQDSDFHTEIIRFTKPDPEKIPKDPEEGIGFATVEHHIFDAGPGAHTFLGPRQILIRQPRLNAGPKMPYSTERWLAVDFDLKPATHPLLDAFNHYRDSLPAIDHLELSKQSPFALIANATATAQGQLFIASWKKKMRIEPILLNGAPVNSVEHLLLSPDEKHFLMGTDDHRLSLGTLIETDEGFSANLKEVNRFEGSYLLSWMGSSRGYIAGVWRNDETDLWIWWL